MDNVGQNEKLKQQIESVQDYCNELSSREEKIEIIRDQWNQRKKDWITITKEIEKEEESNYNKFRNIINECNTKISKLTNTESTSNVNEKKLEWLNDIMNWKHKEISNIHNKLNKKENEVNEQIADLTQEEQDMFNCIYAEIIKDCNENKGSYNYTNKFASEKLNNLYVNIFNSGDLLESMNIDNIIGHKWAKLNWGNIMSDLVLDNESNAHCNKINNWITLIDNTTLSSTSSNMGINFKNKFEKYAKKVQSSINNRKNNNNNKPTWYKKANGNGNVRIEKMKNKSMADIKTNYQNNVKSQAYSNKNLSNSLSKNNTINTSTINNNSQKYK